MGREPNRSTFARRAAADAGLAAKARPLLSWSDMRNRQSGPRRPRGRCLVASCLVLGGLLMAAPVAHGQQSQCRYLLGFQTLHDAAPNQVGDCVDDQAYASNGDARQHTTAGLLVWRKADNWAAFTNGYQTWIEGPTGLAARLNTERFPWEARSCCVDASKVVLNAGDTDVPAAYVLSAETAGPGGTFSRTLQSRYSPEQALTSSVSPAVSHEAALSTFKDMTAGFPRLNRVLGQPGAGFQSDGSVAIGDASDVLESKDHFVVVWVKDNYLLYLSDSTGLSFGYAVARATAMESRLEALRGAQ